MRQNDFNEQPAAPESAEKPCSHPAHRNYAWVASDGVLCVGCCQCGAVLRGASDVQPQAKEEEQTMPNSSNIAPDVQAIAEAVARHTFTEKYQRETEPELLHEEALGVALARWAEYDGMKLLRVLYSALEDANFHEAAGQVQDILKREESE